jgi:hypothetical protein
MLVGQPVYCGDVLRTDIFSDSENCYWEVDTITLWHDTSKVHKEIPSGERIFHCRVFNHKNRRYPGFASEFVRETNPRWWFWKTAEEIQAERVADVLMEGGTP